MSYFQSAVVKAERHAFKVLDGSLPYIEISRKYERKFIISVFYITAAWLTAAVFIYKIAGSFSFFTLFLAWMWWVISYFGTVIIFFRGYKTKAIYQRAELRQTRGGVEAELKRMELAAIAAQDAQRRIEHDKEVEYNRVIYQMRLNLRRLAENEIKERVRLYREQEADTVWEPNGDSAKRIYAEIREDIKAANLPEHGLLRNTTDGLVGMVLGRDRSWLPPDMTEEQIAARHLPKPARMVPNEPTAKVTGKRKR